jgi:chromosome segregation ATPase
MCRSNTTNQTKLEPIDEKRESEDRIEALDDEISEFERKIGNWEFECEDLKEEAERLNKLGFDLRDASDKLEDRVENELFIVRIYKASPAFDIHRSRIRINTLRRESEQAFDSAGDREIEIFMLREKIEDMNTAIRFSMILMNNILKKKNASC